MTDVTLLTGDCMEQMASLPDASVHCCVTSPPYWGLRDYGVDGQLGLEGTPEVYVAKMVEVFSEVWRVLLRQPSRRCLLWAERSHHEKVKERRDW